jgi:peptidylprolyl isomerase/peptidyl-prolyl cis-trans isomerase B (cyclophilin B)
MKKIRIFVLILSLVFLFSCNFNPVIVIVTNKGNIEIELDNENAPGHTKNFIKLVNEQFYVGTTFHRVIPGGIIQGGDPNSKDMDKTNDGLGGPGYTLEAEFKRPHLKWSVAAARQGDQVNPQKRSNGSQFYICLKDLPGLDQAGYSVFGKVVNGFEIVEKISKVKKDAMDNPIRRIVIERIYEK